MANDLFGRPIIEGLTLDDMYETDDFGYGPLTNTLVGISKNRKKKGAKPGGEQPNEKLLGPDVRPLLGPNVSQPSQQQSLLGPNITAGLGAAPPAAPTGVPLQQSKARAEPIGQGFWGSNTVRQSPTGPSEERLINNMTKDPYRTDLLRYEGSRRHEGADPKTGDHKLYRDGGGWATGYGQSVTPEIAAELGIDLNNPDSIANARVPDVWARDQFAKKSTESYQQGQEYLAELGLPASGPLADIMGGMAYQMGAQGMRGFTKMGEALKKGDTLTAAKEMLNSKWAKQTPGRAQEMAEKMAAIGPLKTGLGS